MIAPGNSFIQLVLALAFVIASGYASGRIHQWYKHGLERDDAFREGYNEASRSMFDMVLRVGARPPATAKGHAVNEQRPSRYDTVNVDSAPRVARAASAVGMTRQRIMVHPTHPAAGKRRKHAA
ncbi:MAG TPA: hypothetical protein VFH03_27625 [Actinoplanes sp.]|nr:hypothetical protein [Actinoplanes sp.]